MTGFNSKRQMAQDKEALKLALDALETADETEFWNKQKEAITAIKEALAQPAQPMQGPVDNDFFKVIARNNPSPDQRPWVGLTDEQQIAEALRQHGLTSVRPGADAHQRYKSKGT